MSQSRVLDFIEKRNLWYDKEKIREVFFEEYHVIVNFDGNFAIFNYGISVNFYDPIVKESRGIIIDLLSRKVVCFPFNKFGNYNEPYSDTPFIDWNNVSIQEKVDGSIIKLWFNNFTDEWNFSTNRTIDAKNSKTSLKDPTYSFYDLIIKTEEYKLIKENVNKLNKHLTYIFELTSPENKVILDYDGYHLTHIGTRNNETGIELNLDLGPGIRTPKVYNCNSLEEVLELVNKPELGLHEGFVVVDNWFHRVKVKSAHYLNIAYIKNYLDSNVNSEERVKQKILEFIKNGEYYELLEASGEYVDRVSYYKNEYDKFLNDLYLAIEDVKAIKELLSFSIKDEKELRKAIIFKIKDNKYKIPMIKAMDGKSFVNILSNSDAKFIGSFIENYK